MALINLMRSNNMSVLFMKNIRSHMFICGITTVGSSFPRISIHPSICNVFSLRSFVGIYSSIQKSCNNNNTNKYGKHQIKYASQKKTKYTQYSYKLYSIFYGISFKCFQNSSKHNVIDFNTPNSSIVLTKIQLKVVNV